MKRRVLFCVLIGIAGVLFAEGPDFSGVFDSTVNYTAGAENTPAHSWGIEEYANLRIRFRPKDNVIFNAAFNLIALSGNFALPAVVTGLAVSGENYAAALELERLYFRINSDYFDTEAGLLRMNFGYGMIWGSSDFLNPRNPLVLNARPRGVLGANFSFYPEDSLKLMAFTTAPKDPLEYEGGGFIPGLSLDKHWDKASIQALYAYETPLAASPKGIHRFGLSLKGDLELGLVLDALYTLNPDKTVDIEGLSMGAGFDYSFLDGDLYVLLEYLFNGSSSVTAKGSAAGGAQDSGGPWVNHNFLYGTALYRFNDFFSLALSTVLCFDDLSFQPILRADYEVFQGFSLNLNAQLPLDRKALTGGRAGELGPTQTGAKFIVNAGARLRF